MFRRQPCRIGSVVIRYQGDQSASLQHHALGNHRKVLARISPDDSTYIIHFLRCGVGTVILRHDGSRVCNLVFVFGAPLVSLQDSHQVLGELGTYSQYHLLGQHFFNEI